MMFIPKKIFASSSVIIADGGDIRFGPNFAYHTFTEDGTFTTDRALTADILVVAGGGGGGQWGGGGGAGVLHPR